MTKEYEKSLRERENQYAHEAAMDNMTSLENYYAEAAERYMGEKLGPDLHQDIEMPDAESYKVRGF